MTDRAHTSGDITATFELQNSQFSSAVTSVLVIRLHTF
jgi:hypothetical protein